jgi:hypothetical protein
VRPIRTLCLIALVLAATVGSVTGQPVGESPGHQHTEAGAGGALPVLCGICPSGREGTGTSWQPDTTAGHMRWWQVGKWYLGAHAQIAFNHTSERGPRGDAGTFSTNHGTINLKRETGGGVFGVQTMWSLEPTMGDRGYPLLLQTGETADGVNPLIDRQHPHDFPMEIAATYSRPLGTESAIYVYIAPVGAPALGPPPFMHRPSGTSLPTSPITHHFFDATHIAFGVATFGYVASPAVKFETSVFRGREPDERRWGLERPGLDSMSVRVSVNPSRHLAVQVSIGFLNEPEQLHPGADVARVTASTMYGRQWRNIAVDATIAWARNKRGESSFPVPGGIYFIPNAVTQAALFESTVRLFGRHAVVARLEYADKGELLPLADPRHLTQFPVSRATAGYLFTLFQHRGISADVGGAVSSTWVDEAIRADYGGRPNAALGFLRVQLH